MQKGELVDQDLSVAQCHSLMASVLRCLGQYEEAMVDTERGLSIGAKLGPKAQPEIALSLDGLAGIEKDLSMYTRHLPAVFDIDLRLSEAEAHCRTGLAIRSKIYPSSHPSIALSLHTLASILVETDNLDEAHKTILSCISIKYL